MTLTHRLLFHVLRFLDDVFPEWSRPRPEPADYVSAETLRRVLARENRR
jgi:hypothetical protein